MFVRSAKYLPTLFEIALSHLAESRRELLGLVIEQVNKVSRGLLPAVSGLNAGLALAVISQLNWVAS